VPLTARDPDRYLVQALEFEGALRGYLGRFTHNRADTAELLQEIYARLLVEGSSSKPEVRSVRAFTMIVARNVAIDWQRHRRVVRMDLVADIETLNTPDETESPEIAVDRDQQLNRAVQVALLLPDSCREIFLLHVVDNHTIAQVAHELGMSEGAVKERLKKATREVARLLLNTAAPHHGMDFEAEPKEPGSP
jgi:RNA polymerase sigma factor (sigma-70 family)